MLTMHVMTMHANGVLQVLQQNIYIIDKLDLIRCVFLMAI